MEINSLPALGIKLGIELKCSVLPVEFQKIHFFACHPRGTHGFPTANIYLYVRCSWQNG